MKKMVALAAALVVVLALLVATWPKAEETEHTTLDYSQLDLDYYSQLKGKNATITVFNWGEYISDGSEGALDVNSEFTNLTGIHINYVNFANNEELYAMLKSKQSNSSDYDVIIPSDYMISRMIEEDMLEKLDFDRLPAFQNVDKKFVNNSFDPQNLYSVPYTWGTVGIIYNTTMVDEDDAMDSWDILWNPKYKGKILMFGNPRDAFGIALKKVGHSMNPQNDSEIMDATDALKAQKPLVQAYVMDEIFDKMVGGEAAIAPYYAGDALTMMDDNEDLAFAIPKEGTNIFIDAMCIPKGAKAKEAAEMYINFMCEPQVAAANIEYIGYSSPNAAAFQLLDEEITGNEITYPPDKVLEKAEFFLAMPQEQGTLIDQMWTQMLTEDQAYSRWLMPVLLVLAIIASIAISYLRSRQRKRFE